MLIQRETLNFQLFLMKCVHLMLSYLFQATAQHLVERCTGFTTRTCNEAIAASMTRNRFCEMMKYLHVSDNANLQEDAKMSKV